MLSRYVCVYDPNRAQSEPTKYVNENQIDMDELKILAFKRKRLGLRSVWIVRHSKHIVTCTQSIRQSVQHAQEINTI